MAGDLALKLRLAHQVTGCVTQKALHARFVQVNPHTAYDPDRAYKWVQGKAAPRDRSVYDDLARVLDLPVTGDTVRACSFEEFRRLVEARHGRMPAVQPLSVPSSGPPPGPFMGGDPEEGPPPPRYLAGSYLAFSMAWSAARAGQLILGGLTIVDNAPRGDASRGDVPRGLHAVYEERLPGGSLVLDGAVRRAGRNLTCLVRHPADEMFMFLCFWLPPAPAETLAGVMSGVAYHDAETRPIGGRVFCVRTAAATREDLAALTGYREARDEAVAMALADAGVARPYLETLAARILAFVTGAGGDSVVDAPAGTVNAAVAPFFEPAA